MLDRSRILWAVALVNIALVWIGLLTVPMPLPRRPVERGVRFMNLNVQQFLASTPGVTSNLDAIAELLRSENPDVVGLQETEVNSIIGANQNGLLWLSSKSGLRYYYGLPSSDYTPGVALLSRWPLVAASYRKLPAASSIARGAVRAVVDSPDGRFVVVVGHLQWAKEYLPGEPTAGYVADQTDQAHALLDLTAGEARVAVLGDFNAGPGYPGPAYDIFRDRFTDAWVAAGNQPSDRSGYTWPVNAPSMRIDFVWFSRGDWSVNAASARVQGESNLSDHRAFFVDASLSRPGTASKR